MQPTQRSAFSGPETRAQQHLPKATSENPHKAWQIVSIPAAIPSQSIPIPQNAAVIRRAQYIQAVQQTLARSNISLSSADIRKIVDVARCFPKHHLIPGSGLKLHPQDHAIARPLLIKNRLSVALFDSPEDGKVGNGSTKAGRNGIDLLTTERKVIMVADKQKCAPIVWTGILREVIFLQRLRGNEQIIKLEGFVHKVNSFEKDDETLHIVLEHCDQGDLKEFVKREQLSLKQKLLLLRDFLQGVKKIHAAKILHRDLKPENLLICTKEGKFRLKITDFDLGCDMSDEDAKGEDVGTPQWIPLDRARLLHTHRREPHVLVKKFAESTTPALDIFPIGTIMQFLLTGQMAAWQKGPPRPAHLPELWQNVVRRLATVSEENVVKELSALDIDDELRELMVSMMKIDASQRPNIHEICERFDTIYLRLMAPGIRPNPSPPPRMIPPADAEVVETVRT